MPGAATSCGDVGFILPPCKIYQLPPTTHEPPNDTRSGDGAPCLEAVRQHDLRSPYFVSIYAKVVTDCVRRLVFCHRAHSLAFVLQLSCNRISEEEETSLIKDIKRHAQLAVACNRISPPKLSGS